MNKNILASISNGALATWVLGIGAGLFSLGVWTGMTNTRNENYQLQQTVMKKDQALNDLRDTILRMKLYSKDTITSLQEPPR